MLLSKVGLMPPLAAVLPSGRCVSWPLGLPGDRSLPERVPLPASAPPCSGRGPRTTRSSSSSRSSAARTALAMPARRATRPASSSPARCSSAFARHATRTNLAEARDALRAVDASQLSPRTAGRVLRLASASGSSSPSASARPPSSSKLRRPADGLAAVCARPGARLVGDRPRSSRAGEHRCTRDRSLPAHRRSDGRGAAARTRDRSRPTTGCVASARSMGDLDRAWNAAMAGWVRASHGRIAAPCASRRSRPPGAHRHHSRARARGRGRRPTSARSRRHDDHRVGAIQERVADAAR